MLTPDMLPIKLSPFSRVPRNPCGHVKLRRLFHSLYGMDTPLEILDIVRFIGASNSPVNCRLYPPSPYSASLLFRHMPKFKELSALPLGPAYAAWSRFGFDSGI